MFKFPTLIFCCVCSLLAHCQTNAYAIYALKFGERKYYAKFNTLAVGDNSTDSTKVYFMYWLLKGSNGKTILVDAGFTEDVGFDSSMIRWTAPEKLLSGVNVKPEDITDIIVTHPHWDHMGGIDLYANAVVWMQEEDYNDILQKQKEAGAFGYNENDIEKIKSKKAKGLFKLITMKGKKEQDILPGITVFTGSKHTPGSQFVLCNNGKQNVCIASDNCKYYRNIEKLLSSPQTSHQKAYINNLKMMKRFVSDTDLIIPGHDPLVLSKFNAVAPNVVEIKK